MDLVIKTSQFRKKLRGSKPEIENYQKCGSGVATNTFFDQMLSYKFCLILVYTFRL